jgi:hypothetical protein
MVRHTFRESQTATNTLTENDYTNEHNKRNVQLKIVKRVSYKMRKKNIICVLLLINNNKR